MRLKDSFETTYTDCNQANGMKFRILSVIDQPNENFDAEVLPMFEIELEDGAGIEAYPEEIFEYGMHEKFELPYFLCAWLYSAEGMKVALPVEVKIGRSTFQGAYYIQKRGELHYQRALYLLGELPASYKRSTHIAYIPEREFSKQEWFIGSYYQKEERTVFQPFGKHFQLMPWTAEYKIDAYEENEYRRMNISVNGLV